MKIFAILALVLPLALGVVACEQDAYQEPAEDVQE